MIANPCMEADRSQEINLLLALKRAGEDLTTLRQLVILISIFIEDGITSMDLRKIAGGSYTNLRNSFRHMADRGLGYSIKEVRNIMTQEGVAKVYRRHHLTEKGKALVLKCMEGGSNE